MLESLWKAIDENNQLEAGFKENIKELLTIFNEKIPEITSGNFSISLKNLEERLKTLQVEKINRLVSRKVYDYSVVRNILSFSSDKIEKYDVKHVLMCALLTIMTSHDNTYGFDKDNRLISLNVGYTEILANYLVGNEEEMLFEDEVIMTNIVAEMIGDSLLSEAYFTNQPELVSDALVQEDKKLEKLDGGVTRVS
jgi:hypothetical protein